MFPLNLLESNFMKRFEINDMERFESIEEQIRMKSNRLKTHSYN